MFFSFGHAVYFYLTSHCSAHDSNTVSLVVETESVDRHIEEAFG